MGIEGEDFVTTLNQREPEPTPYIAAMKNLMRAELRHEDCWDDENDSDRDDFNCVCGDSLRYVRGEWRDQVLAAKPDLDPKFDRTPWLISMAHEVGYNYSALYGDEWLIS